MGARHRIAEMRLDLTFESDAPRLEPTPDDALLALARDLVLPALEAALDEAEDGAHRYLESLVIDLGDIPAHMLGTELPQRLRDALRGALAEHARTARSGGNDAAPGTQPWLLAHFERFLRTGTLEAGLAASGPGRILEQLVREAGSELAAALRRVAAEPGVIRRLAQQFEPARLRELLPLLVPAAAARDIGLDAGLDVGPTPGDLFTSADEGTANGRLQIRLRWEQVLARALGVAPPERMADVMHAAHADAIDTSHEGTDHAGRTGLAGPVPAEGQHAASTAGAAQARLRAALSVAGGGAAIYPEWERMLALHAPALRAALLQQDRSITFWQPVAAAFPLSMLHDIANLLDPGASARLRLLSQAAPGIDERQAWLELVLPMLAGGTAPQPQRDTPEPEQLRRELHELLAARGTTAAVQVLGQAILAHAERSGAPARYLRLALDDLRQGVNIDLERIGVRAMAKRGAAALPTSLPSPLPSPMPAGQDPAHRPAQRPSVAEREIRRIVRTLLDADGNRLGDALALADPDATRRAIARIGPRQAAWERLAREAPEALLMQLAALVAPQAADILRRVLDNLRASGAAPVGASVGAAAMDPPRALWLSGMLYLSARPFNEAGYRAALAGGIVPSEADRGPPAPAPHGPGADQAIVQALLQADAARLASAMPATDPAAVRRAIARLGPRHAAWERLAQQLPEALLLRLAAVAAPQAPDILGQALAGASAAGAAPADAAAQGARLRALWLSGMRYLSTGSFDAEGYRAALSAAHGPSGRQGAREGHSAAAEGAAQTVFQALRDADAGRLAEALSNAAPAAVLAALVRLGPRHGAWERLARQLPQALLMRLAAVAAPQAPVILHQALMDASATGAVPADPTATGARLRALWLSGMRYLSTGSFDAEGYRAALVGPPGPAGPQAGEEEAAAQADDAGQTVRQALLDVDATGLASILATAEPAAVRRALVRLGPRHDIWERLSQQLPEALLMRVAALAAPQAPDILRQAFSDTVAPGTAPDNVGAAGTVMRALWMAGLRYLSAGGFDAEGFRAALAGLHRPAGQQGPDPENAAQGQAQAQAGDAEQAIRQALLEADTIELASLLPAAEPAAVRRALARLGARHEAWERLSRRLPEAMLMQLAASAAPQAPDILRQVMADASAQGTAPADAAAQGARLRALWLSGMRQLSADTFDAAGYQAALTARHGPPRPPGRQGTVAEQPARTEDAEQTLLQALLDADATKLAAVLPVAEPAAVRRALARLGARHDAWQRLSQQLPEAMLMQLVAAAVPQAPDILRQVLSDASAPDARPADASAPGAQLRSLWLSGMRHLGAGSFDAAGYRAALSGPRTPARPQDTEAQAAAPTEDAEQTIRQALLDADAVRLAQMLAVSHPETVRRAMARLGPQQDVRERLARRLPEALMAQLSAPAMPSAQDSPPGSAQDSPPDAGHPTPAQLRRDIAAAIAPAAGASPALFLDAVRSHSTHSKEPVQFLRQVLAALREGKPVDLAAIADQLAAAPDAPGTADQAAPAPARPFPSGPGAIAAGPQTGAAPPAAAQAQAPRAAQGPDSEVLRRIADLLGADGAANSRRFLDAVQDHAARSTAPRAYLEAVHEALVQGREVDLEAIAGRLETAAPQAARPATRTGQRIGAAPGRLLARHPPAHRAALLPLLQGAGDDSTQFPLALLRAVAGVLAGSALATVERLALDVADIVARPLPQAMPERLALQAWQFAYAWFFEDCRRFEPAAFAHALAAHLAQANAVADMARVGRDLAARLGYAAPPAPAPAQAQAQAASAAPVPVDAPAAPLEGETIYVGNAGQVLVAPYLPRLFSMLGLLHAGRFKDSDAAGRAVHLLQYVVDGRTDYPEYLLGLNRLLCGVAPGVPVVREIVPSAEESDAVEAMLRALIEHWKRIGNTTPNGLRQAFLQRPGSMFLKDDAWRLKVEPGPFDMLLDTLPWSFSVIKHPWMERSVHVEWR